jgi:hypothetical protein
MTRSSYYYLNFMVATEFQPAVVKRASGVISAINGFENCFKSLAKPAHNGLA